MNSRMLIAALGVVGIVASGAVATSAENRNETQTPPPTQPMPRPVPGPRARTAVPAALTPTEITVVACLYRTADLAARDGDKTRISKEFVLADTALGDSGATPASGALYQVDKLDAAALTPHVGKRVEMVGQIEPAATKVPEFDAVSIREVAGSCPVRPTTR